MASNKKVANGLVAASCAAVLAVYAAGYNRTRSAVEQFEAQANERRAADPEIRRLEVPVEASHELREGMIRPRAPEPPAIAALPKADAAPMHRAVAEPQPVESANAAQAETPAPSTAALVAIPEAAPVIEAAPSAPPPVAEQKAEQKAEAIAPAPPAPAPAAPKWKDGTYYGWGTSRHGDIQAEVVVKNGRISATISDCRTRYPCSVIEMLPPQVAQRQSPDVDYVSRATQSANAFYFAVVDALSKAK